MKTLTATLAIAILLLGSAQAAAQAAVASSLHTAAANGQDGLVRALLGSRRAQMNPREMAFRPRMVDGPGVATEAIDLRFVWMDETWVVR